MNFFQMKPWLYAFFICVSVINTAYSATSSSDKNNKNLAVLNAAFSQHQALIEQGHYFKALELAEQSYELAKENLSPTEDQRLIATDNYALNLRLTNNFTQAHTIFKELLGLYDEKYGKHGKELLPILADIRALEQQLGDDIDQEEAKATVIRQYRLHLRHNSDDFVAQFADQELPRTKHANLTKDKVTAHFDKSFDIHETEHWSIIYPTKKKKFIEKIMSQLIEKTYQNNISFLVALGLRNEPIKEKMTAVVFESATDYKSYMKLITGKEYDTTTSEGLYNSAAKSVFLYDRGVNQKGRSLGINALTLVHVVSHQVMSETGLESSNQPKWFKEGIAVSFEYNNINNSFGAHTNNHAFKRVSAIKKRLRNGSLMTLKELVTFDDDYELFENQQEQTDLYALSTIFVRFLYEYYPDEVKKFLAIVVNAKPLRDDSIKALKAERLRQFTKAFGDPDWMQEAFTEYTEKVVSETDAAYAAYVKRRQNRAKGQR